MSSLIAAAVAAATLAPVASRAQAPPQPPQAPNAGVLTLGFSADCLETLEEIAVENAHVFKRYGGENFAAIPCLNDSEAGMLMIWQLAMRELKGWV